jgi:hypothetical protein
MKEAELQAVVANLFQRFPELVGFSVGEAQDDLCLAGVETFPADPEPEDLMGAIAVPLIELLEEDPEARELLNGRTFARTLH